MANPTPSSSASQSAATVNALLGEFFEHKQREAREVSLANAPQRVRKVLAVTAFITCAIVWILPSFYTPQIETPSAEREDASARMTLFLASERVRAFQRQNGALPRNLAVAGVDSTGISYEPGNGDRFDLRMSTREHRVVYRSTMPTAEFLGSALQTLTTAR